jgi:hypothetical protein
MSILEGRFAVAKTVSRALLTGSNRVGAQNSCLVAFSNDEPVSTSSKNSPARATGAREVALRPNLTIAQPLLIA